MGDLLISILSIMAGIFIVLIGAAALLVIVLYILDVSQTSHAIRRNYPVIGRLRALFEHLGKFFRQYFFAMDREEMPFNREQRDWVGRAAKECEDTPFLLAQPEDLKTDRHHHLFANSRLSRRWMPWTASEAAPIGDRPDNRRSPLRGAQLLQYLGDELRLALGDRRCGRYPAARQLAGCWLNTGEGGMLALPFGKWLRSDVVFQIGTAKYGVRDP